MNHLGAPASLPAIQPTEEHAGRDAGAPRSRDSWSQSCATANGGSPRTRPRVAASLYRIKVTENYREFYVAQNLVAGLGIVFSKLRGTTHALDEETGN
jgi:hypothetical protein